MLFRRISIHLLLLCLASASPGLFAQQDSQRGDPVKENPELPDSLENTGFSAMEITRAFSSSFILMAEAEEKQITEEALKHYRDQVDSLFSDVDLFLSGEALEALYVLDITELQVLEERAGYLLDQITRLEAGLSEKALDLQESISALEAQVKRWELTLSQTPSEEMPQSRMLRIMEVSQELDSVRLHLLSNMGKVLGEEDRLAEKRNELVQLGLGLSDQEAFVEDQLFSRELPNLLDQPRTGGEESLIRKHGRQISYSFRRDLEVIRAEYSLQLWSVLVLFSVVLGFLFWYKSVYKKLFSQRKFKPAKMHKAFIDSPVATGLFIAALLIRFTMPELPRTFHSMNFVVTLIPLYVLVIRVFGKELRTWFLLLICLYVLTFFYELTYDPDLLLRLVMLFFSLSALALFLWVYMKRPQSFHFRSVFVQRMLRLVLFILTLQLLIAVVANFLGAFALSEFFTFMPIQIMLLAVGVQMTTKLVDAIIYLLLVSHYMQKINVIKDDWEFIHRKTFWIFHFALWTFFVYVALDIFRIREKVLDGAHSFLTNGIKIGAAEVSLGSIFLFIIVIWLSVALTRVVRHILEKDVFSRVATKKGIPTTVVLLVRVSMLTAGFFLAAASAGIKLSNLSIVLGAFSVGIGFGLQNVFNNVVSGLILALERPIKVGDVVQVGELTGVVKSIGLRSSNVKSFDGAEVIVPNGNLISKEMVNWTHSSSNRRMDIRVGVAYGTKPSAVVELMQAIAEGHEQVDKEPPPMAYFIGFGDSSLDFRLLAWTDIDHRLKVESELNMSIEEALKKAGIEVPFPQRDLHIVSDGTKEKN